MAKFTAFQPTSNVILAGIGILANPHGVRFDNIDGNGFSAESSTVRLEIGGDGFRGSLGRPKAVGTVTDIKYFLNGTPVYQLSHAKYPFHDLASSNDTAKHTQLIFAKDDKLIGSFGTDTLEGFKGSDRFDGKAGNDTLYGDGGKDTLGGGEGYDVLDGGKGKDTYVFKADPITGWDSITKFEKGEHIELKTKFFAGLEVGELTPDQFVVGSGPLDTNDRIIYNSATGYLSHDADGLGGAAPVIFAKIQVNADFLSADNFLVF